GDAEDVVLSDGMLSVSFERDHRIMQLGRDGLLRRLTRARAFEPLPSNLGIEGLAAHPGG
ncbi:MAG: esterase-like activity of phytase family protein, partial [Desulfuromonadales bacterium]|nr:esterase-like activity of phytase family protein [Desulfuromonadales bacterium]